MLLRRRRGGSMPSAQSRHGLRRTSARSEGDDRMQAVSFQVPDVTFFRSDLGLLRKSRRAERACPFQPCNRALRGGSVTIAYVLATDADVTIDLYGMLGRRVTRPAEGPRAAGKQQLSLEASPRPPVSTS
jgi:hypothetical protein